MREIISIHVGQAGNQIGFSNWELLCAEHGISCDGRLIEVKDKTDRCFESFFSESHCGQYVPRGLFIDLEPSVIDQLRTGSYRNLYHPMQLVNGNDDSSSNFSRAFNTIGRLMYRIVEDKIRKQVESCNFLLCVLFHRSLAGGTGSGLTSMIFELMEDYIKTVKFELPIHQSPHFDSCVVGPYNSILGEHFCMDECDVGLLLDNEALFDISCNSLMVSQPTMTTINRILAQVNSCLTASSRFSSDMFNDLNAVLTNLVPYPRIHFPLVSFAPLGDVNKLKHDSNSPLNLTRSVFEISNQLVKCDPYNGKYMACSLVYRGLVNTCEVYSTLSDIKASRIHKFVDWCPTGFKVGIVDQPPLILPESFMGETKSSVIMMTNSSAVSAVWQRLAQKFHQLYTKRSFVHWFVGEGLEECEFCEALYNIATLAKDYEEVSIDTKMLQLSISSNAMKEAEETFEGEDMGPKVLVDQSENDENKGDEDKYEENEDYEVEAEPTIDASNSSNFITNCNCSETRNKHIKTDFTNQCDISYGALQNSQCHLQSQMQLKPDFLNLDSLTKSLNNDFFVKNQTLIQCPQEKYQSNNQNEVHNRKFPFSKSEKLRGNKNENCNTFQEKPKSLFGNRFDKIISESEDEEFHLLDFLVNETMID